MLNDLEVNFKDVQLGMLNLKRVCEDLIKDHPFNDLNLENLQSIS
jgi:hypothetical protein